MSELSFPLRRRGSLLTPGQEDVLAPGVRGYAMRSHGVVYIPIITADTPGSGDVSRFLDSLPTDETIRVPCVINPILAAALERRGFTMTKEYAKEMGEWVEVYERKRNRMAPKEDL